MNLKALRIATLPALLTSILLLSACSSGHSSTSYLESGSIIMSSAIPTTSVQVASVKNKISAPLLGYIPPRKGFVPAINESWLEIDRESKTVSVFKGDKKIITAKGKGKVFLEPGEYALQTKKENPYWYAGDEYFTQRGLVVPSIDDTTRFRRGALGQYAMYPTSGFAIHAAPVWTKEIGGFRLSEKALKRVYEELSTGARIVIK